VWEIKDASIDEFPMADRILIDAPCSGTGVLNKKPDIKWRRSPGDVHKFAGLQLGILNNMIKYLAPHGTIVYATCSMEHEENWDVVNAFLKLNPDFRIVTKHSPALKMWIDEKGALVTFPPEDEVSGMFAVKMVKI
jgi:16S rRNA (cytosine967-C5)-methyltransferase